MDWKGLHWRIKSWLLDQLSVLIAIFLAVILTTGIILVGAYVLADPIVQKDSATGRVVAVITAEGTQPASYFEQIKDCSYDVEWVAPRP